MLKVFKWLWDKAQDHGERRILDQLYGLLSYHRQQAEIAFYKEKYELGSDNDDDMFKRKFMRPKLSPKEHGAVAGELSRLITDIERQREHEATNDRR